jgi:hypothetical protein
MKNVKWILILTPLTLAMVTDIEMPILDYLSVLSTPLVNINSHTVSSACISTTVDISDIARESFMQSPISKTLRCLR